LRFGACPDARLPAALTNMNRNLWIQLQRRCLFKSRPAWKSTNGGGRGLSICSCPAIYPQPSACMLSSPHLTVLQSFLAPILAAYLHTQPPLRGTPKQAAVKMGKGVWLFAGGWLGGGGWAQVLDRAQQLGLLLGRARVFQVQLPPCQWSAEVPRFTSQVDLTWWRRKCSSAPAHLGHWQSMYESCECLSVCLSVQDAASMVVHAVLMQAGRASVFYLQTACFSVHLPVTPGCSAA
jgi:hypothetical protein